MDAESITAISQFLFVRDALEPVDIAFVVGSPTVNSISPAVDLFRSGLTIKILISGAGVSVNGQTEWACYRDYALAAGVPLEALLLEKNATAIQQNIQLGTNLISNEIGWYGAIHRNWQHRSWNKP
jgi:uncharacterized SAM-binding protein YcdF (DUF218 family)